MWMKWRHKFAHGPSSWEWKDIGSCEGLTDDEFAQHQCSELSETYNYSERYRGIDYELFPEPPLAVAEEALEIEQAKLRYTESRINELDALCTSLREKEASTKFTADVALCNDIAACLTSYGVRTLTCLFARLFVEDLEQEERLWFVWPHTPGTARVTAIEPSEDPAKRTTVFELNNPAKTLELLKALEKPAHDQIRRTLLA